MTNPVRSVPPAVDIVVPVHNEEVDLGPGVRRLHGYLAARFPFTFRVTIVDNASSDGTWPIARRLAAELDNVAALRLERKGRGRALRHAWLRSDATVVAYMDVDLSTDLNALLPLVAPLLSGHSDITIGSRLDRNSRVLRGPKREVISRGYNALLHAALGTRFSDAQCGFKAARADVARQLVPLVEDEEWFFDTELLVLAERAGLRIGEVPVDWTDDPDSRVDVAATAWADLLGVVRLLRAGVAGHATGGQVLRFAAVGVASTLGYLLLYLALRPTVSAQPANMVALLLTAVANTWANRRFTFVVRGRRGALRHQAQGLVVFAAALAITSGSLAALTSADPHPARTVEVAVLVVANLAATVLRFALLRSWVFAAGPVEGRPPAPVSASAPRQSGAAAQLPATAATSRSAS